MKYGIIAALLLSGSANALFPRPNLRTDGGGFEDS